MNFDFDMYIKKRLKWFEEFRLLNQSCTNEDYLTVKTCVHVHVLSSGTINPALFNAVTCISGRIVFCREMWELNTPFQKLTCRFFGLPSQL